MKQGRSLRRVDVLILVVAATAVMLRNDRDVAEMYNRAWGEAVASRWPLAWRPAVGLIWRLKSDLMAGLIVATVGAGLDALRLPFLPRGRRWPTRGMAAIAVGALGITWNLSGVPLEVIANPTSTYQGLANPRFFSYLFESCQGTAANAILGAWSLLALAGRWRSDEDGLGWLGRGLGWCWLLAIAFELFQATLW